MSAHNGWLRANALFSLAVVALSVIAACASFTDRFTQCQPRSSIPTLSEPKISIVSHDKIVRRKDGSDELHVTLDIDYDLSHCATWNTRAVHAQVTIGYETERRLSNEATVWDRTATTKQDMRVSGRFPGKYGVRTVDEGISGRAVELKLRWAVLPRSGKMWRGVQSVWNSTIPAMEEENPDLEPGQRRMIKQTRTPGMP
ncbi:Signal peptidase 22kDa subunit [Ostreococcus tauri]|uniref:Signal peptidase complex subunit 3 n=1 Tax=Ostreococcus tauri TaxID=70448 RepID=Q00WT5_OSTTA|nr:Signal peptidase 22kDa subunit [Ostreococcus tauri]OUS46344.1 signal peptidase complex subunit [Ostreococcus tauri]CAL56576.1 Signal peptidase 22kDa subunit [Ostreococcus tauri]|eukprot:XP_003082719.1 Signal peptidase 22kDa subunit [Ostreococcus tauri]